MDNTEELKSYIYVNFTPRNRERAIVFYSEKSGVGLEEATIEVERIFAQRQRDGMVLETPKQWTPEGRQYEMGKRMYHIGFICLVIMILIFVLVSLIIMTQGPLLVNEVVTLTLLFTVFLPAFLFLFLLGYIGKKKMKKYADVSGENVESITII